MKLTLHALAVLVASLTSSCAISVGDWGADVVGSGVSRTELRNVDDFRRIAIRGSTDVVGEVGERTLVEVTADDNLLEFLETRVVDGTLVIEMKDGSYSTHVRQLVRVVSPALEGVEIAGSGNAELAKLAGERFIAEIAGSGDVALSGSVAELSVSIAGSGGVGARALAARRASVEIAGSGDVAVAASETLDVSIAGSGDVVYVGDPKLTQQVAGSGDVRRE